VSVNKADIVKAQARAIAVTGKTNMFCVDKVFRLACAAGYTKLADLIRTNKPAYVKLILTGELTEEDVCESPSEEGG